MKKTILFAILAAVLGFTACSKDEPAQNGTSREIPRNGMILRAAVAQPADSKATFTDKEGVWHFDFAVGDIIKVTNDEIYTTEVKKFYTFTYDGTNFVSADAEPTEDPTTWYAYFPDNKVPFDGQSGSFSDVADKFAMHGTTASKVTGEDGLNITLNPEIAILKINNQKGSIDINIKASAETWFSGVLPSEIKEDKCFTPYMSNNKQTLLSATEKGIYYIAVPAGFQLSIKNGDETLKSTGVNGLTAGKYYEITLDWPDDAISGKYTVNSGGKQVYFSKGNLYNVGYTDWLFEEHQYSYHGFNQSKRNFGMLGWSTPLSEYGTKVTSDPMYYEGEFKDWGTDICTGSTWRTLSIDEWKYLLNTRTVCGGSGADKSYSSDIFYGGAYGVVLYPDDYSGTPISGTVTSLPVGAVFLPYAGRRTDLDVFDYNTWGYYWSSTSASDTQAYLVSMNVLTGVYAGLAQDRREGCSVRLVMDVE